MPYLGPGPIRPPVPLEGMDELQREEAAREAEREDDYDEMRDEPSSGGQGKWLVILLVVLGIAGLVALLYWGLSFFYGL